MNKEIEKAIDRLSNEVCKYNINAIDYPSVIVLREDVAKLINLTKKLEQQLKKKDEVISKAINIIKQEIPEEYIRSCDTEDGVGRYELDTESWQYKVYDILKEVE